MPPKSDLAHVTQLIALDFLTAKSTRVDFAFPETALQLQIEAHAPSVYRLRCGEPKRLAEEKPGSRAKAHSAMLLARQEAVGELAVSSMSGTAQQGWRLEQGDVALEIIEAPLQLALYRGDDCVMRTRPGQIVKRRSEADATQWLFTVELNETDALYGLGEAAGGLDHSGSQIISDHIDCHTLPLVWSPGGWGIYVNGLERVEHDLGASDSACYEIRTQSAVLDIFIFVGAPVEILNHYTALTGRAGQPSLWPMGVWLDQAPGQTLEATLESVKQLRAGGYGLDVVRLAPPAVFGFQPDKPAFEWDLHRVPDSRTMLAEFAEQNVQLAAPTFPGVLEGTTLFEEWEDRGWLLLEDDSGSAHVFPGNESTAGHRYGLLDLTNKDVFKLWSERHRQVFDEGLGAPVCNARIDIPDGITARGGETGATLRTLYPMLVRRALFDAVAGHKTPQEGIVLSSDLFPSCQRYAWQLGPEVTNDWAGLNYSLRTALSLSASGVAVQTHRLGSASQPAGSMTAELYVRWLAMAVFSGNLSLQGAPELLPAAFDDKTRELVRHWLQWRYRLIPYVLGIIEDAVRTGLPVQRPMALVFPDDPIARQWDTQYLLGPALLVAPVVQPGNELQVYLPEGDAWWDLNTGWRYEGGTTWTVEAGLETLPVFGREGHMLCLGPTATHTGEFNSARILDEVWMFGMPEHSPVVMRNKIRVMQMQGSSYIKGLEGLRILPCEGLEVKRRGAEVRISRAR